MVFLRINFIQDQSVLYSSNINYYSQIDIKWASKFEGNNRFGYTEIPWTFTLGNWFICALRFSEINVFFAYKLRKNENSLFLAFLA